MFVARYNDASDSWGEAAGILRDALEANSGKITRAAQNYRDAEIASGNN
ncbi:hypothetical protein [Nonomuraea turkmeniaca]|nr:hypothetical protein [Nonomuraea turkmeniaca]